MKRLQSGELISYNHNINIFAILSSQTILISLNEYLFSMFFSDSVAMTSGNFSEQAKMDLLKKLLTKMSKAEQKSTSALETTLDNLLRAEPDRQTQSMCHLYHILRAACKDDYSLLEIPKKQTETKDNEENIATPKIVEALRLPLPNQFVPHFVGKQGVHINQLSTRLGVEIRIVSPCSLRRRPVSKINYEFMSGQGF